VGLNLDLVGAALTRWIPLKGHLTGVGIKIKFAGTEEGQKFRSRLEAAGIIKVTREDPLNIRPGRETEFFRAVVDQYVLDWREEKGHEGCIKGGTKGTGYDPETMADVLRAYPSAYLQVMAAVAEEDAFFVTGPDS
jgi:hypothetical protein